MKRILPILALLLCVGAVSAQNPFEKFGYTPKIGTLSKGKYIEHFDTDSIVQIGSVLFNPFTKKITGFVVHETVYSEATLQPEIVSRWLTPDPLSEEFPDTSPYVFTNNNPIFFTDPTGLAPETIYQNMTTGETVEVNDGVDKTIEVNEADFQKAKFFANEINDQTTTVTINGVEIEANIINYVPDDIADAYTDFYNEHNSYDEFSLSNLADYAFNGPEIRRESDLMQGGEGALGLIGGPAKQGVKQLARLAKIQRHHIIPKQIFKRYGKQLAPFMKLNSGFNLKKLPTPFHGNHPQYNKYVGNQIQKLINEGTLSTKSLQGLQKSLNSQLNKAYDSGMKLNDYFRKLN